MADNPFTPTFGVTPPLLVGRDDVLDEFRIALDGGPGDPGRAMLLTGVRGAGKTVALNACEDEAHRRGWAVISETVRPGLVLEMTSTRLPELLTEMSGRTTKDTVTGVTVMAAGFGGGLTRQRTDRHPVVASLRSQLTRLADLHAARDSGVLLSLDEVHRQAREDIRVIAHTVQHLFREGRPVAFLAAGLPAAIEDVLNDAVLTFLRRAERFVLGPVSAADVALALRTPIENAGRRITPEALAIATSGTQGYPFLVQLVGYQTWAVRPDDAVIDASQARIGVERAVRRVGRLVLAPALGGLSRVDRSFLTAMAVDPGPSRMADIADRLGVSSTYASQYRLRLLAAEVIAPAGHGLVRFELPYLRDYLQDHPGTEVVLDEFRSGRSDGEPDQAVVSRPRTSGVRGGARSVAAGTEPAAARPDRAAHRAAPGPEPGGHR